MRVFLPRRLPGSQRGVARSYNAAALRLNNPFWYTRFGITRRAPRLRTEGAGIVCGRSLQTNMQHSRAELSRRAKTPESPNNNSLTGSESRNRSSQSTNAGRGGLISSNFLQSPMLLASIRAVLFVTLNGTPKRSRAREDRARPRCRLTSLTYFGLLSRRGR